MNAEHADLKARFAAPAERDLPPGRHDLHREILMNHMLTQPPADRTTRHGGGRNWRPPARVLAGAAVAAAVAAGAAGYAFTAASTPAVRPPDASRPPASRAHSGQAAHPAHPGQAAHPSQAARQATPAATVLDAAAAHLARTGTVPEPAPGQWIYYKTVSSGASISGAGTDEEWMTFDGSGTAYYQDGQLVTHTSPVSPPGPAANPWAAWNADFTPKTAYDVLASLPASPHALLAVIASHAAAVKGQDSAGNPIAGSAPKTEAQREFDYLTQILWNAAPVGGGPPAAEAAAYRALATLHGITVQRGITDTAGGQAIGVSDDGGFDQLLIDPVSYQVIGIRQRSTGISPETFAQMLASGHAPAWLRKHLSTLSKAQRAKFIANAKKQSPPAVPPKGTVTQEIVYMRTAEVAAPGDR